MSTLDSGIYLSTNHSAMYFDKEDKLQEFMQQCLGGEREGTLDGQDT
ncbi:MAG: hypothetical protein F6K19_13230 [Cyanothece sp. SIO1E1]|nr:hypothetical protein [Cyanothece sp. SIO1E1]